MPGWEMVVPELPPAGDEFAGYLLRSVIGRGGMSVVYEAEHPRLGNGIALKVMAAELAADEVFRTRFLTDARIAASMNHPHVIPIYDMGSSDGLLYIAMRRVSDASLRQLIAERGPLRPQTIIALLSQAARALDAAHRTGLVHRDVKPENLLIERDHDAGSEHLYLADFGISRLGMERNGLTSTGQFLGTIDYVAPEQLSEPSVYGSADQYSLGCVLFECLTGRVPFDRDAAAAVARAGSWQRAAPLVRPRADLPGAVNEMFDRVLADRPGDRYNTCREFIEAAGVALGDMALAPSPRGQSHATGGVPDRVGGRPEIAPEADDRPEITPEVTPEAVDHQAEIAPEVTREADRPAGAAAEAAPESVGRLPRAAPEIADYRPEAAPEAPARPPEAVPETADYQLEAVPETVGRPPKAAAEAPGNRPEGAPETVGRPPEIAPEVVDYQPETAAEVPGHRAETGPAAAGHQPEITLASAGRQPSPAPSGYRPTPAGYQPAPVLAGDEPTPTLADYVAGSAPRIGSPEAGSGPGAGPRGPGPAGAEPDEVESGDHGGRRWGDWLVIAAVLLLICAGGGAYAALSSRPKAGGPSPMTSKSMAAPRPRPSLLTRVLTAADDSKVAMGMLPPSSCRPRGKATIVCTAPWPTITRATFTTYPTRAALFAAYEAKVRSLRSGRYRQNVQDCGLAAPSPYGEIAWNHQEQHSRAYTVDQMIAGKVPVETAMGRMACMMTASQSEDIVWTTDYGKMLGVAIGRGSHTGVWYWWIAVHHNIVFPGTPMDMGRKGVPLMSGAPMPTSPASGSPSMPAPSMPASPMATPAG